jgi:hypothetical protein
MYLQHISKDKAKKLLERGVKVYANTPFNKAFFETRLVSIFFKEYAIEYPENYFENKIKTVKSLILNDIVETNAKQKNLFELCKSCWSFENNLYILADFHKINYQHSVGGKLEVDVIKNVQEWLESSEFKAIFNGL